MQASDKKSLVNPLRQVTLCFLVRDEAILLAYKKRGFGQGKWNGVGGKPIVGETIIDAAIRETQEEICVTPKGLKQVGVLDFYFPDQPEFKDWNQEVVVFLIDDWEGEPKETDEVKPQWFPLHELPFSSMWPDDIHWLPKIIQGNRVKGKFQFDKEVRLENFSIETD